MDGGGGRPDVAGPSDAFGGKFAQGAFQVLLGVAEEFADLGADSFIRAADLGSNVGVRAAADASELRVEGLLMLVDRFAPPLDPVERADEREKMASSWGWMERQCSS